MEPITAPSQTQAPPRRLEVAIDGFTDATFQVLDFYAKQVYERALAIAAAENKLNNADQQMHIAVGSYAQKLRQPVARSPVANVINRMFDGGRHLAIDPRRPEAEDFDCPMIIEARGIRVNVFLTVPLWRSGGGERLVAMASVDPEVIAASPIVQQVRWSGDSDAFGPVLAWRNLEAWRQLFGPNATTVELGIGPNGRGEWLVHAYWDPTAAASRPD